VAPETQIPVPNQSISADNLDQVVELARWGKGVITDAIYSPDGKSIAVGTTLGVSIYKADTLEEVFYFETGASVNSLAFSPDGETIATGLKDNTVKLWKASDGSLVRSIDGHHEENPKKDAEKPEITSVAFSPDGNLLAGGSKDGLVSLWQVSDGGLVNTSKGHTKNISSVFFSADGQAVFSASWDGKVRMENVATGEIIRVFSGQYVLDAAISADGKTIATYDHRVYISPGNLIFWDVESGKKLKTIASPSDYVITSIVLSSDGQYIAASLENHTVKIWSVASGILQNTFEDLQPKDGWYYLENFFLSFSPDGQSLSAAGVDTVGIWDFKKGTLLTSSKIKNQSYDHIALSPNGKSLAAVDGPNVDLIQIGDGSLIPTKDVIQSNGKVAFSPDGSTLLVSMFDNTARLWPISDQGIKKSFETDKKGYIRAVAYSPDGKMVALEETYTGKVELRQVSDGSLVKSMQIGTSYGVGSLAFSPDGNYLAGALGDQIRLFKTEDGKPVKLFNAGIGMAFSPDGTMIAGGGEKKTITIWKVPTGDVVLALKDRPDIIHALEFSPDGKYLVAGYEDGTIEVFLVSDGTLLKSWKAHSDLISDLLFTADGKYLISASYDGTIRMWGLKP